MNALIKKDFRLNRLVFIIILTLGILPYFFAVVFAINQAYAASIPIHRSWPNLLLAANHFCLMHWPVAAAMLGGNAFACERADRSSEFLAYLPPTRLQVATSKFVVPLFAATIFGSINLGLFWFGMSWIGDDTFQYLDLSDAMPKSSFAAISVLTFGVGWMASSVLNNTGPAVVIGLASPAILFAAFQFLTWAFGWPDNEDFGRWFSSSGLSLGLLSCLFGWYLFLSRRDP